MRSVVLLAALCLVGVPCAIGAGTPRLSLFDAVKSANVTAEATLFRPGELQLVVQNRGAIAADFRVAPGTIFGSGLSDRTSIALAAAELTVEPGSIAEVVLPVASLTTAIPQVGTKLQPREGSIQRLAPLFERIAARPDFPRATAQLLIFALLENITYAQWRRLNASGDAGVGVAVEALAVLREIAPGEAFALRDDSGLKLLALRDPRSRARAMQIYGITPTEESGNPPDLQELLHTRPGDDCPICRSRADLQRGPGDL